MILDGVVQQRRARHVRVVDPVMRQDPDRDPQRVAGVRLALPPVPRVQPPHPLQGHQHPLPARGGQPPGLD
jgi:hypothetical protein